MTPSTHLVYPHLLQGHGHAVLDLLPGVALLPQHGAGHQGSVRHHIVAGDPGALNDLVNVGPLLGVGLETLSDQVLALRGHIGPFPLGELILTRPDPLLHAGGDGLATVGVKWRVAADSRNTK